MMVFNIMGMIVVSLLLIRFPFAQGSGIVLRTQTRASAQSPSAGLHC
jgi:hypothetical protein